MVQEILTDTQIWEVASNEAVDLFGDQYIHSDQWRTNKEKWFADRLKVLTYENDLQKMVGGHLDIKA